MSEMYETPSHDTRGVSAPEVPRARTEPAQRYIALFVTILVLLFLLLSNQWVILPALPNWYDQQRFLALFVLATGLILYGCFMPYRPPFWLMGLTVIALALAALSSWPGWALAEAAIFFGMGATAFWIKTACRSAPASFKPSITITLLVILATAICLQPLMQILLMLTSVDHEFRTASLFIDFSNHRFFSQAESILIPLMVLPAMMLSLNARIQSLGNVITVLLWMMAFAAGTRAFYVAMVLGALFAFLYCGRTGRQWVQWQAKFAMLGGFCYSLVFMAIPYLLDILIRTDNDRLANLESAFDSSGRLAMWRSAWNLIIEHPWTGIGPMHFATLATHQGGSPGFAAHPHNAVIQILVEWGLPFGLLVLGGLAVAFWRLRRVSIAAASTTPKSTLAGVMLISWTIAFIYSLLDGSLVTPYTQVLLAVFFGWSWSLVAETHQAACNIQPLWLGAISTTVVRFSCMIAGAFLIWLAVTPYKILLPHAEHYAVSYPGQPFWPRFWSQGLINLPSDSRYNNALFNSVNQ